MNPGDKVRVKDTLWADSFGNSYTLVAGEVLTIKATKSVAGQRFLSFELHPGDYFFWSTGFTSLKHLH